mmetsp:Transcript_97958/g.261488  ORF Transcript_97958/g.261488 Transcript_97958/m.261488 type:complete len:239 (+) Transcript_97958:357-1073(+)
MVQDALPTSAQRRLLVPSRGASINQICCSTSLPRPKHAVPHSAQRTESVVAPLVSLVVPIMVMGHLSERKPSLNRVGQVESTAHPGVLLQAFEDSEHVRKPECAVVQGNQNLGKAMTHDRIRKIVQPVVLISVPRQGMPSPVVKGMNLLPQHRNDVQSTVHPVHPERKHIVIPQQSQETLVHRLWSCSPRKESRDPKVQRQIESELTQHGDLVVPMDAAQLFHVTPAQVLLLVECMLP